MTWQENLKADYIKSVKSSIQQLSDFLGERKFLAGEKVQHQNDDCVSFQVTVKSVKKQEYITHKNLACISKAIACVLQQKQTWDTLCIISWLYLYQSNMSNMTMYAHSLVYKYTHNCSCHKVWKFFLYSELSTVLHSLHQRSNVCNDMFTNILSSGSVKFLTIIHEAKNFLLSC